MNEQFSITDSVIKAFQDFAQIMADGLPRVVMAIVVFLAGYIIAKIVAMVLLKSLKAVNFDSVAIKLKLEEPLRVTGFKKGLSHLLSQVVFWLIMLVVIVTTSTNLGIDIITDQVNRIIDFIPSLVSAIIILLAGYFVAVKIKEVLLNMTRSLGSGAGRILANIIYYFIMVMVVITAIDQTGIWTDLISNNILLIVGVILLAGAIAYGYAAREIMRNMLSSFYSKRNFYEGQRIKIGDLERTILTIDNTSVILKTSTSKVVIPASELMSNKVEILENEE
ncbi:MAG: hypothetical protein RLZZ337_1680 [Bacteroidota bacterium]|jgi:hypothetical protein